MSEVTSSRIELLFVDLATGVALAQNLQSLIATSGPALPDEPPQPYDETGYHEALAMTFAADAARLPGPERRQEIWVE